MPGVFRKGPPSEGVKDFIFLILFSFLSDRCSTRLGVAHGGGESAKRSHLTLDTNDTKKSTINQKEQTVSTF